MINKLSLNVLLVILGSVLAAQPTAKQLTKSIEKARQVWAVPGLSVGVVYKNEVAFSQGFGTKKAGTGNLVDASSQFAIASNTKAFIAAALATLVQDKQIQWDDPVRSYLPEFEMYDEYVTAHITIKDLLCHRAGLGTFSGDVIWYKSQLSASEVIERIKYIPQAYEFRSGYGYSNLMFITAGEVIKSVTGQTWDQYIKEQFLTPLGMDQTITSTHELSTNQATPHKPAHDTNQPISWVNWDNMGAAGGIISSATDMTKWIQMLLNQGVFNGDTLLDKDQINEMWTPHNSFVINEKSKMNPPGRNFNGYGLGWGVFDYYGRKVMTHSGGYDGMYSRVVIIPEEELGFVILSNSMSGIIGALMFDLINQYLKADTRDWQEYYFSRDVGPGMHQWTTDRISARKHNTEPTIPIASYSGTYHDPMYGAISIALNDGQLRLSFEHAPDLSATLIHWQHDTWEIKWDQMHAWFDFGLLSFESNTVGEVVKIRFDVPNHDIFFDELHPIKR
jgi:CubicO group peptidase (beta-lactamase class C family)